MSFEKAMEILDEYDKGTEPRTLASLSCGCQACGESCKKHEKKSPALLTVRDLHVEVNGKEVLGGVTFTLHKGDVHALMGPNATGKSTLCYVLAGHPGYKVTKGSVKFQGKDLLAMPPEERAQNGLFLVFQNPVKIPGVTLGTLLFHAYKARHGKSASVAEFNKELTKALRQLNLEREFIDRELNVALSGGEKKRAEVLQLLVLKPVLAVLDEADSGLDIDSLKVVSDAINTLRGPTSGCLVITHYNRILTYVKPDCVHVLLDGKIAQSGDAALVKELEKKGYSWLKGIKVVD